MIVCFSLAFMQDTDFANMGNFVRFPQLRNLQHFCNLCNLLTTGNNMQRRLDDLLLWTL